MNAVKEWAISVCITLIITGTAYKFLPEKSSKNLVRFIVTLICLTAVFKMNASDIELFDFDGSYEQSIEQSQSIKSDIEKVISGSLSDKAEKSASDILVHYDENGKISVQTEKEYIRLTVTAELNETDKKNFEKEVKERLETEIEFFYP